MVDPTEATADLIHDRLAETYGYDVDTNTASRLKLDLVLRNVSPSDNVLDLGCANGIHLHHVARGCREIVGVDINDRMLALARAKLAEEALTNARLVKGTATDLGFADGTFDLVYSLSTLLLVPNIDRALREIVRVVKPGGTLILDIAGRYNLGTYAWRWWYRKQGHPHLHAFSRREIVSRLQNYGLEAVESHAIGFTDQWRYIPVVRRWKPIDRLFHEQEVFDRDYRISNMGVLSAFAGRWYLVAVKRAPR